MLFCMDVWILGWHARRREMRVSTLVSGLADLKMDVFLGVMSRVSRCLCDGVPAWVIRSSHGVGRG